MKAKFKRFFSSIGFTKAQLITVFLCYFLCFALFLGVVVIWDPMSKSFSEQTIVADDTTPTAPTNTDGWWITEGRYSIEWYTNAQSVEIDGTTYQPGTEQNPYIIASAEDLAGLSWLVYTKGQAGNPLVSGTDYSGNYIFQGKYFKQTVDIDLSAYYWQPIGINYTRDRTIRQNYFSGSYDGDNHTVSGIFTPAGSTRAYSYQGLFGYVYSYGLSYPITIKNIGITDSSIQGYQFVGGVVGCASGSTITNCYNTGNVTSTATSFSYVGGVVGGANNGETITNCYNAGEVTGDSEVGGVVGVASDPTITNCYNTGDVSGSSNIGGVVGVASDPTITNCYNTGSVTGSSSYVGGVVGYVTYSSDSRITISNCSNSGLVSGSEYVGGVVGYAFSGNSSTTISNCSNTGSVNGSLYVGGVVGYAHAPNSTITITNCYNMGSVNGSSYVGGVVGVTYNDTTISNSANFGDIKVTGSSGVAGGIVGYITIISSSYYFKLTHCYSEGALTVTGTNAQVGGFVGQLDANYSTYTRAKIEFCSVDLDIVVSGGSIASQGAFYGGTNGLTVENSYSLLTKSGTVSKAISDVSTQMNNNFGYMLNFKEGKPIPLGIFHILDVATRTGIVNRINAL